MKALIIAIMFFLCTIICFAQITETLKLRGNDYTEFIAKNQYKYPAYTKAKISFKNAGMASAKINYNNFQDVIKYIDAEGDTLDIANADEINYISVGADTIFHDNGYYQWVASSATARLVVKFKYKEAYRAPIGAFGISSPAKNVQTPDRIIIDEGAVNDSRWNQASTFMPSSSNEEVTFTKQTMYYISPLSNPQNSFLPATKKNIDTLFPKLKVEDFIKDNKLNLNKEEDLIDLMVYISKKKN